MKIGTPKFQKERRSAASSEARKRDKVAPQAMGGKPKLLDQVRELLRAKYHSIRTEEAYLGWSPAVYPFFRQATSWRI